MHAGVGGGCLDAASSCHGEVLIEEYIPLHFT